MESGCAESAFLRTLNETVTSADHLSLFWGSGLAMRKSNYLQPCPLETPCTDTYFDSGSVGSWLSKKMQNRNATALPHCIHFAAGQPTHSPSIRSRPRDMHGCNRLVKISRARSRNLKRRGRGGGSAIWSSGRSRGDSGSLDPTSFWEILLDPPPTPDSFLKKINAGPHPTFKNLWISPCAETI